MSVICCWAQCLELSLTNHRWVIEEMEQVFHVPGRGGHSPEVVEE